MSSKPSQRSRRRRPPIALGAGADLFATLAEAGLIDTYRWLVIPKAIGQGRACSRPDDRWTCAWWARARSTRQRPAGVRTGRVAGRPEHRVSPVVNRHRAGSSTIATHRYSDLPMADFTLRPMEPSDGPAIDALMRHEAQTTSVGMTTNYRHDVYAALVAQHPSLSGVVAESPGPMDWSEWRPSTSTRSASGPGLPMRSPREPQGPPRLPPTGAGLAAGGLAHRRGTPAVRGEGVVTAGVEATNSASLATARRWSTDVLGPVRLVIARTSSKPSPSHGVEVRPMTDGDIDTVLAGIDGSTPTMTSCLASHRRHSRTRWQPRGWASRSAPTASPSQAMGR